MMLNIFNIRTIALIFVLINSSVVFSQNCNSAIHITEKSSTLSYDENDITCSGGSGTLYIYFRSDGTSTPSISLSQEENFDVSIYGPFSSLNDGCSNLGTPYYLSSMPAIEFNIELISNPNDLFIVKIVNDDCMAGRLNISSKLITDDLIPCENCIPKFNPPIGKYILSAWVKEEGAPRTKTSYTTPSVEISFTSTSTSHTFYPTGEIIDGWQKIDAIVDVQTQGDLEIKLKVSTGNAYFDDIRFYPYDGSVLTYVYDPINLRLVAELDERNYAKIYEYDEEGKLIRVKKETEKGIMTIQESRENSFK